MCRRVSLRYDNRSERGTLITVSEALVTKAYASYSQSRDLGQDFKITSKIGVMFEATKVRGRLAYQISGWVLHYINLPIQILLHLEIKMRTHI